MSRRLNISSDTDRAAKAARPWEPAEVASVIAVTANKIGPPEPAFAAQLSAKARPGRASFQLSALKLSNPSPGALTAKAY